MGDLEVYKRGFDFPNEGFVQRAIEEYFYKMGYMQINERYSDFVCINPNNNEKWVVEAKGETKAIGLDFRTCLGQLIQRIDSRNTRYAIALPNIISYINQCKAVKQWVRKELQIYWLFVDEDGKVKVLSPEEEL